MSRELFSDVLIQSLKYPLESSIAIHSMAITPLLHTPFIIPQSRHLSHSKCPSHCLVLIYSVFNSWLLFLQLVNNLRTILHVKQFSMIEKVLKVALSGWKIITFCLYLSLIPCSNIVFYYILQSCNGWESWIYSP